MSKEFDNDDEDYCIIETGFNIFYLIAQYIETKGDKSKPTLVFLF